MVNNIEDFKGLVSKRGGMAQANLFNVILPAIPGSGLSVDEGNLLCSTVSLPGLQLQTVDRTVGTVSEKVATGSVHDDVSFTFKVLNDYGIKKYFDSWQKIAYNKETHQIGYKNEYRKQVTINQLKKTSTGLALIYECKLFDAWPISTNSIDLTNDQDGLVEITVQLSYTRWTSRYIN